MYTINLTNYNLLPTGLFCRLLIVFKINFFEKDFRTTIRASNSLYPDQARRSLSGLLWVQTVCKEYQQMPLVGKLIYGPAHGNLIGIAYA